MALSVPPAPEELTFISGSLFGVQSISWTPPRGGLLALLRYGLDIPSLDLADRLAAEYSVMLAPGAAFGFEGYLRLGLGQDPTVFAEGLARTAACFADLRAAGVPLRLHEGAPPV